MEVKGPACRPQKLSQPLVEKPTEHRGQTTV